MIRFCIALLIIGASGCSKPASQPIHLDDQLKALSGIDVSIFDDAERVDCDKSVPTDVARIRLGLTAMRQGSSVLRTAGRPVRYLNGEGYLVGAEVAWSPGDPGVRLKRVDYYIFNATCRARFWKSGPEEQAS